MKDSKGNRRQVSKEEFFYVIDDNYDEHAELAIPNYTALHEDLARMVGRIWQRDHPLRLLDLGAGTGKTTEIILTRFPNAKAVAVDKFPEMLSHAEVRLGRFTDRVEYLIGDFMDIDFGLDFDLCVSSLAIHHQDPTGKQELFEKVFNALRPGGVFSMIDWIKFNDPEMQQFSFEVAEEHVRKSLNSNPEIMSEWVEHWRYLNIPDSLEDQLSWLKNCGFQYADCISRFYGIALLYGRKLID